MQKYTNAVTDRLGNAIVGATVNVTDLVGATAALYIDNGVTLRTDALTTDANGAFEFYAPDGRYNLSITKPGITPITINDVLIVDAITAINDVLLGLSPGGVPTSTDLVIEGVSNKYFTEPRVLSTALSGLDLGSNAEITATDTVVSAAGKLQKQATDSLAALVAHTGNTSNPHAVTKTQVGLGNVDNTSDAGKPVSTAQATAINAKMTNPMTTAGDVIIGGASGTPTRLPAGSNGQVLTLSSGAPAWAAATGGSGPSIFTDPATYSAVGDGTTSDQTAIANTITQAKENGGAIALIGRTKRFLVTSLSNPRGVRFFGDGAVVKSITGGVQKLNSEGDLYQYIFGREYMAAFHNLLVSQSTAPTRQLKVLFSGDSTTSGDSASSPFYIHELFKALAENEGLQTAHGINAVNVGHSGKHTGHWVRDYLAADLAAAPDMYVLRWGINDPGYLSSNMDATPPLDGGQDYAGRRTVDDFITSLRSGLATIRASKTVSQLTVVLMTPNSTSDTPNGRDELWYESIIPGIRQAARDYQCVFLDTYSYLRDSRSAAGVWMDDIMTSPSGRAIHPLNIMNVWISNLLAEVTFPPAIKAAYGKANVTNIAGAQTLRNHTDLPATYPYGMSVYRAYDASGWPLNGTVITWRSHDETLYQILYPFKTSDAAAIKTRIGRSANLGTGAATLVWEAWVTPSGSYAESQADVTPGTGYTLPGGSPSGNMRGSKSGSAVNIEGYVTKTSPASVAANTAVATLPAGYRPVRDSLYGKFITAWDGTNFTAIMARIQPDGAVVTLEATVGNTQRFWVTVGFSTLA